MPKSDKIGPLSTATVRFRAGDPQGVFSLRCPPDKLYFHVWLLTISLDRSGAIKREEFSYLFCAKLKLLSHDEVEALLCILDR